MRKLFLLLLLSCIVVISKADILDEMRFIFNEGSVFGGSVDDESNLFEITVYSNQGTVIQMSVKYDATTNTLILSGDPSTYSNIYAIHIRNKRTNQVRIIRFINGVQVNL